MRTSGTIFFFLFLLAGSVVFSQEPVTLPVPLEILKCYRQGTRSPDGRPGPAYWQNHSDYTIRVQIDPETRVVTGNEEIIYYNGSPDSLDRLVVRLYQDYFRKGNFRDFAVDPADLHDGVKILKLRLDNREIPVENNPDLQRHGTNMVIPLSRKLPPHASISVKIGWQYKHPGKFAGRFGTFDSTSFFFGYWYPQISVYDDIDGWDEFSFHGIQEFYCDFNNYDVYVKVPRGFVVWATGRLQNAEEVLQPGIAERYRQAWKSDDLIHVITAADIRKGKVTGENPENTWHFKASEVKDFAFGISDHYLWDLTGLTAENQPDKKILIAAAYQDTSGFLPSAAEFQKRSILYYSNEMPAVAFPYPSFTLFEGTEGMEYPMMNCQGDQKKLPNNIFVTSHELAHTYFPFLVGINERKYAWMDEGWAMFIPAAFQSRELGGYDIVLTLGKMFYDPVAGSEFDLPPAIPSITFGPDVFYYYRYNVYARPHVAYTMLEQMLGEKFLPAFQEYIRRWKGKHPMPYDFFYTFNEAAGENLDWFWKPWFFEIAYPDLELSLKAPDKNEVTVTNKGGLPLPVRLTVTYADGTAKTIERSVRVWKDGKQSLNIPLPDDKKIVKILLGEEHIPDIRPENNEITMKDEPE